MTGADPTPPTNLRATRVTTSGFRLEWDRSPDADWWYYSGTLGLDSFGPRDVPYVDYNGLPPGVTVEAVVYAYNEAGFRSAPATAAVTTAAVAADPTPAVERGMPALREMLATEGVFVTSDHPRLPYVSSHVLTAALTDPDDPDWLARTLHMAHTRAHGQSARLAEMVWSDRFGETNRRRWRAVADGLKAALTGSGT